VAGAFKAIHIELVEAIHAGDLAGWTRTVTLPFDRHRGADTRVCRAEARLDAILFW